MKLWKGNLLKGEYEITHKEIYNDFIKNIHYNRWRQHKTKCDLRGSLIMYLTAEDGLYSMFEFPDFDKLFAYVKPKVEELLKNEVS